MSLMMVIFRFFNTFVNAVFWYLFNDIISEHLLARFMSWFRLVSTLAVFKTYGRECFFLRNYWYFFMVGVSMGAYIDLV